ncbi:MAG: hypothetical protein ACYS15_08075 [Planctomycetota bacterium]|jgi:hypothetical protein
MFGISLVLGDGVLVLPLEQTLVWALFYSTLFWLPARGVAAMVDRCRGHHGEYILDDETATGSCYHLGKNILPPF